MKQILNFTLDNYLPQEYIKSNVGKHISLGIISGHPKNFSTRWRPFPQKIFPHLHARYMYFTDLRVNFLFFIASQLGKYPLEAIEVTSNGHSEMYFMLISLDVVKIFLFYNLM